MVTEWACGEHQIGVMHIGMKLATYLANHSIPIATFAQRINVTAFSVHRYVSGARVPRPKVMARIKEATGGAVSADDFFEQSEEAVAS